MAVGDYWIVNQGKRVIEVIERKTVDDLKASIQDGRYAEQPTRIIRTAAPLQFVLVIGSLYWIKDLEERKAVQSAMIHLQHAHDRLRVEHFTEDSLMPEVLAAHWKYAALYAQGNDWIPCVPEVEQVKRECKKRKIDNQQDAWLVQVCCVEGVSLKRGEVIVERFRSASQYLEEVRVLPNERDRERLIADLKVPIKNGFRRLGDVISKRFYQCLVRPVGAHDSDTLVVRRV